MNPTWPALPRALPLVARRQRGKLLRIEAIDGEPARTSGLADTLRGAAFTSDPRGLVLEAQVRPLRVSPGGSDSP